MPTNKTGERLQYLAAIVDSFGDAIVSQNLDGVVTSRNRAAETLLGCSASDVLQFGRYRAVVAKTPSDEGLGRATF